MKTILAKPIEGGYSWTLTSRLGHMLQLAEQAFGPRDKAFTILGIEFEETGPRIWYPGNCGNIAIQLTPDTQTDIIKGCYQLAHECIHLLSPVSGGTANMLEEGLATYFAHDYVQKQFRFDMPATVQSYEKARQLVRELLEADQNAVSLLRSDQSVISKITAEQISRRYPSVKVDTIQALVSPF